MLDRTSKHVYMQLFTSIIACIGISFTHLFRPHCRRIYIGRYLYYIARHIYITKVDPYKRAGMKYWFPQRVSQIIIITKTIIFYLYLWRYQSGNIIYLLFSSWKLKATGRVSKSYYFVGQSCTRAYRFRVFLKFLRKLVHYYYNIGK